MSVADKAREAAQMATQAVMSKLIPLAPDSWIPGGRPDPLIRHKHGLVGTSVSRVDGPAKVGGEALFAAEFPLERMCYAALAFCTVAKGRIATLDLDQAEGRTGRGAGDDPLERAPDGARAGVRHLSQCGRARPHWP